MIEIIDNIGPNTLDTALGRLLRSASEARFQIAFATASGVASILSSLQRTAQHGSVRLITGFYQYVTEPEALRLLHRAARASSGRIQIRVSSNPNLHTKLYLITLKSRAACIVGSSNLSQQGMNSAGELNLFVLDAPTVPLFRSLFRRFEEAWKGDSVELTLDLIRRYEHLRPNRPRAGPPGAELRRILGPRYRARMRKRGPDVERALWRDYVDGYVSRRTEHVVRSETDWDRLGYDWYSRPSPKLRRGDHLLLFDFAYKAPTVHLAQVRAIVRTSLPTPDGREFIAHSPSQRYRARRLTSRLWSDLIKAGAVTSQRLAHRSSRLSNSTLATLRDLFRRTR